jgi:broad specificity phosphatase PhoE
MTRILLIRHGNTDLVSIKLCGRLPGIPLNSEGLRQSQAVGLHLRDRVKLHAVYSSPVQRAVETADAIADAQNLPVELDERLSEMDFGDWTGYTFEKLKNLEAWHRYNRNRSLVTVPGGESLIVVQARAWECLSEVAEKHKGQTVAMITHGDVIRVLLVLFLGMPLDHLLRLEVAPGSITEVALGSDYPVIASLNKQLTEM